MRMKVSQLEAGVVDKLMTLMFHKGASVAWRSLSAVTNVSGHTGEPLMGESQMTYMNNRKTTTVAK